MMTTSDSPLKPVTAVVLAAGESRRMGEAKLLLPWGERTILEQTLHNLQATTVDGILLVSGAFAAEVEAIAAANGIQAVHNPDFATGEMLSSLQVALTAVPDGHAILVMLGDLPMIGTAVIDRVVAAYRDGRGNLIAPVHQGRRGHPVLIGPDYLPALSALPPGGAPRDLLQRHEAALHLVAVDTDTILQDVDTPEEYARRRPPIA